MKGLTAAWGRVKARAFPAGAITFHLAAWSRGALSADEAAVARGLLGRHGFGKLLVLHASAVRIGAETVVLAGPRGVGKSTACRALERRGEATLVEDGLVLVGEADGRWTLVETGTLEVLRHAAVIAASLRRLLPRSAKQAGESAGSRRGDLRSRLLGFLDGVAFKGGVLVAGRERRGFVPRLYPVHRVVVVDSLDGAQPCYETDGNMLTVIAELGARIPDGVVLVRAASTGLPARIRAGLTEALLG